MKLMKKGICLLSHIPGRKKPADSSEMITQLIFGDTYEVLEETEKWLYVKQTLDGYESWICIKQFYEISDATYQKINQADAFYVNELITVITNKVSGETFPVVYGSRLPLWDMEDELLQVENITFSYDAGYQKGFMYGKNAIVQNASMFLNAPYLWGGKSPFGIDCSGFVQMVFKLHGIMLPRDAYQQAEIGTTLSFVEEAEAGDLAFFDNEDGKIIHVGIVIGPGKIIHASGKVRVDLMDHYGIFNEESGNYSHKLRILKRVI